MDDPIRYLPVTHRRITGWRHDGTPLEEITSPGLIDIRAYPALAPFTVPRPEVESCPVNLPRKRD